MLLGQCLERQWNFWRELTSKANTMYAQYLKLMQLLENIEITKVLNKRIFVHFHLPMNYLDPVRTSHFASAEFNAKTENPLFLLICIRFGACEMRRLNWVLQVYVEVFYSRET